MTISPKQFETIKPGEHLAAHRASFREFTGIDPGELHVCHKCDTPACVNPDNMQDCISKGRRGDQSGVSPRRLSETERIALRAAIAAGASMNSVSRQFGVSTGAAIYHRRKMETA